MTPHERAVRRTPAWPLLVLGAAPWVAAGVWNGLERLHAHDRLARLLNR